MKSIKLDSLKTVPVLTATSSLAAPEQEMRQPPLTPTSPCDGRLRSILKKSLSPTPSAQLSQIHVDDKSEKSSEESSESSHKSSLNTVNVHN